MLKQKFPGGESMKRGESGKHERIIIICAYCRKNIHGQELIEKEIHRSGGLAKASISHGICPDCLLEHFPNEYLIIQEERRVRIKKLFEEGFKSFYGHLAK